MPLQECVKGWQVLRYIILRNGIVTQCRMQLQARNMIRLTSEQYLAAPRTRSPRLHVPGARPLQDDQRDVAVFGAGGIAVFGEIGRLWPGTRATERVQHVCPGEVRPAEGQLKRGRPSIHATRG
eukprot:CAMPEP_0179111788 /NCGR_PEP_ID=MMETSP0796-20121207/52228_1 /TAXON_ID=73915 /ORGANISM="Pyrodinium bahamense, Strain pbaha01" /LENGTH=123 /DNA_ID=CAMNT_0020809945 /DNA_START=320 /DNA_END=688 /DNA_ORIENTATION=+